MKYLMLIIQRCSFCCFFFFLVKIPKNERTGLYNLMLAWCIKEPMWKIKVTAGTMSLLSKRIYMFLFKNAAFINNLLSLFWPNFTLEAV